jgi:uncharacterized protein YbbC (DUF1343 family)
MMQLSILILLLFTPILLFSKVAPGLEQLFTSPHLDLIKNKKVALLTNQTAVTSSLKHAIPLFKEMGQQHGFTLHTLFAPEHWIDGSLWEYKEIKNALDPDGIPIYPLWGKTQRPTDEMLKEIDILVYDIQDIGSRSYTYIGNLFICMEEAAKKKIPVLVLDRPNPINGLMIDGPMLEKKFFGSIVGYMNVPYCHGMTVGELADYYNHEYQIGCELHVVPMQGWKRWMSFTDTDLFWIPSSPNIPQANTPLYYPITGIIGELNLVNIGINYTKPFEVLGAPYIDAVSFSQALNQQKLPGVQFTPHYWMPTSGTYKDKLCKGILIHVIDPKAYLPVSTAFTILGLLKTLYPKEFSAGLKKSLDRMSMLCKVTGCEEMPQLLNEEKYITWKLRSLHEKERKEFVDKRKKYLIAAYH